MNSEVVARKAIIDFLKSENRIAIVSGSNTMRKHKLVIRTIDECYRNAKILFRLNGMDKTTDPGFVGLKKQPKSGQLVRIGNNYYAFDNYLNAGTWYKTSQVYDIAIFYPSDIIFKKEAKKAVENILLHKQIKKIFFVTWLDHQGDDASIISNEPTTRIIYDCE